MAGFEHALILLLLTTALSVIARWVPWPAPITYVLGGVVCGLMPAFNPKAAGGVEPTFREMIDTWIEMGAGRGKGCFWLAHFVGCQVIGIEWIPQFMYIARALKALFGVKQIQFTQVDIEQADLTQGTIIYLYGLWPNLKIKEGVKVITISEPLDGYRVLKSFWVRFPWGRTTAYVQKK